jgi:uncharacterized protein involved in response to NO
MHSLVRRFIKTGIIFLVTGLLLGGWMMVRREFGGVYPSRYLLSAHTHLIAVGFVMQMILGVALWLFPRPAAGDTRYDPRLATAAWWLVSTGTAVRAVTEIVRDSSMHPSLRWGIVLSGAAQIVGISLFFYTMWTRIRALGSKAREASGERF